MRIGIIKDEGNDKFRLCLTPENEAEDCYLERLVPTFSDENLNWKRETITDRYYGLSLPLDKRVK